VLAFSPGERKRGTDKDRTWAEGARPAHDPSGAGRPLRRRGRSRLVPVRARPL